MSVSGTLIVRRCCEGGKGSDGHIQYLCQDDVAPRLSPFILVKTLKNIPSCRDFTIVGGEPLLYKDEILEIVKEIACTNIRTIIITNAVLLTSDFIDKIKNYNIHFVFSIDTIDKGFWKFVRGCDSFDLVMNNLKEAFYKLTSCQMSIQSVLAKETAPYIEKVKEFAEKQGLYHSIQNYVQEGFEGNWTPIKCKTNTMIETGQQCFAAGRNLSIMQNGNVTTCFQQQLIGGFEMPLGNLHTDSITTILESVYIKKVIDAMKSCNRSCRVLKCNLKR